MSTDIRLAIEIHEAFSKTNIDLSRLKDNVAVNTFKTEEEMWTTLNPFFTTLGRVRPGLPREVFMNVLSLFPIMEEELEDMGSGLEKSLTAWDEHGTSNEGGEKYYSTLEWKASVVGSFIRKGWPFRSIKRIESTVIDLKRSLDEFQEEQEEDQDQLQWLVDQDADVTDREEIRRARLRQRLPWDLANDRTAQGITSLYKDIMEITEEINQFFKNRLTDIFPGALRLAKEDYPLSGYLGFAYIRYWISLQFKNRTAPRNLIDLAKTLVAEAEVDDLEKLLDVPLQVCTLLKQLKRPKDAISGRIQEVDDLERELVRSFLGKCKTSKIDEVSFLGKMQAAEGNVVTMVEVQRRISNIYADYKARRQYGAPGVPRQATVNNAQVMPSPEVSSNIGRGSYGRQRGSDSRGRGGHQNWRQPPAQQGQQASSPWQNHGRQRGHAMRGRLQGSETTQPRRGDNGSNGGPSQHDGQGFNSRGQRSDNRGGRGRMQPGRRGRREHWAGPLIPHNQPETQPPDEQEEAAEPGRAGSSGDWHRRR